MEPGRRRNWLVRAGITPILVPMALGSLHRGVEQGPVELSRHLRARWGARHDQDLLRRLRPDEEVVLFNTGSGLKYVSP